MEEILQMLRATLEKVEVSGKDNLARVLGCMDIIDTTLATLRQPQETPRATEDPGHIGGFDIPRKDPTVKNVVPCPDVCENMEATTDGE